MMVTETDDGIRSGVLSVRVCCVTVVFPHRNISQVNSRLEMEKRVRNIPIVSICITQCFSELIVLIVLLFCGDDDLSADSHASENI